jgi:hypothetical protein
MKIPLRIASCLGFLLFALGFAATFLSPIHFERAGKEFIGSQVEDKVRGKIDDLHQPSVEKAASLLAKQYQRESLDIELKLAGGLSEKVANVVAQMQDLSCECRSQLASNMRHAFKWRIASLNQAQSKLIALAQGKYIEVVEKLLADLRIFTGSNAAVFLLLLAVSCMKTRATLQLLLPAALLLAATLVCSYFYLFEQNWFFTIIHNSYLGLGYLAYLSRVFLFLCDIALNRARVTTWICNKLLEAVGNAGTLSPC